MKNSLARKIVASTLAFSMVFGCSFVASATDATTEGETEGEAVAYDASLLEAGAAEEGDKYGITIASYFPDEGPAQETMEAFKTAIEDATNKRITVDIQANGALGNAKEISEGLHAGTINMGAIAYEDMESYGPEYAVFEAPYLFRDLDHFWSFFNQYGDQIFSEYEEQSGIKTAAITYRGARMITANKEVKEPEDLKGLKFRLPSMPIRVDVFEAFGASPTIVDFSELYMALKTGTVDAEENPPETIYSYKYYEAQKYMMLSRHIFTVARYCISDEWFDTLSEDDQKLILNAWKYAQAQIEEKYPDPDEEFIEKCKEEGMEIVEPDNAAFQEIAAPVVKEYSEKNWKEGIYDLINSL